MNISFNLLRLQFKSDIPDCLILGKISNKNKRIWQHAKLLKVYQKSNDFKQLQIQTNAQDPCLFPIKLQKKKKIPGKRSFKLKWAIHVPKTDKKQWKRSVSRQLEWWELQGF